MSMTLDSLKKLYVHELKDLYSAETQIQQALDELVKAASDDDLKELFREHRKETDGQVKRLDKIFAGLDFSPRGQKCDGMAGLIKESSEIIREESEPEVRDAALIAAAQRVEHYEIAGYGVARTYAEKLGRHEDADLLQETLNEEGLADQKLTRIAERKINFEALAAGRS